MSYQAIADQLGWKARSTTRNHDTALAYRDQDLDQGFAQVYARRVIS